MGGNQSRGVDILTEEDFDLFIQQIIEEELEEGEGNGI